MVSKLPRTWPVEQRQVRQCLGWPVVQFHLYSLVFQRTTQFWAHGEFGHPKSILGWLLTVAPSFFSLRKSYPTEGLMPCSQWLPGDPGTMPHNTLFFPSPQGGGTPVCGWGVHQERQRGGRGWGNPRRWIIVLCVFRFGWCFTKTKTVDCLTLLLFLPTVFWSWDMTH